MSERKTAGELSLAAARDSTRYDLLEVGEALTNDLLDQIWACIDKHHSIIDEPEFCIVFIRAKDSLIRNVMRRKFYAWPYLPSPRPEQAVFHYNKVNDDICRLWSLPSAKVMAVLSEMTYVAKPWKQTKAWCDAFYAGRFYEHIRAEHRITLLSESEYLNANREKLIQAGCKQVDATFTKPFDFGKVSSHQLIDPFDPLLPKQSLEGERQTQNANRNICA